MIEMRWLERERIISFGKLGEPVTTKLVKILQYRTVQNPLELGLQEPIWSEWQDVPVVREVENAASI